MVNNVTDINNNKKTEMNFLKEKMNQVGVTQKELANKLVEKYLSSEQIFTGKHETGPWGSWM